MSTKKEIKLEIGQIIKFTGYSPDVEEEAYEIKTANIKAKIVSYNDITESPFMYEIELIEDGDTYTNSDGEEVTDEKGKLLILASDEFEAINEEQTDLVDELEANNSEKDKAEAVDGEFEEISDDESIDEPVKTAAEKKKEAADEKRKVAAAKKAATAKKKAEAKAAAEEEPAPKRRSNRKAEASTPKIAVPKNGKAQETVVDKALAEKTEPTEVKKKALEGDHIPKSETTDYIGQAKKIVNESASVAETLFKMKLQKGMAGYVEGMALSKAINDKVWIEAGYDESIMEGFARYCPEVLGMEYRVAMNRVKTYEVFTDLGEEAVAMLVKIGMTQSEKLARLFKKNGFGLEDAMATLNLAHEKGLKAAEEQIKIEHIGNGDGVDETTDKWTKFSLSLPNDQGAAMTKILDQVIDINGGPKTEANPDGMTLDQAFFYIATEFSNVILNG